MLVFHDLSFSIMLLPKYEDVVESTNVVAIQHPGMVIFGIRM